MSYIGDMQLGQTFDTKFCTVQSTGAPTTLAASPVISNYVGNNTTELTAGITLTADFDSRTGLNNVHVVATSGNGYATATDNQLVITTGTVNSVSAVGYVVAEYSIENRVINAARTNLPVGTIPLYAIVDNGTLQSATGTTAVIRSAASFADSRLVGMTISITGGTGVGQARIVTAYTNSSKTVTVDTWTTTPDNTSTYILYPTAPGSTTSPAPTNVVQWSSGAVPSPNVTGVPLVDDKYLLGTIYSTPATAGIADVNLKNVANAAVSTTSAQIGVNVVSATSNYGIKKNTALANYMFQMTDSTTHLPATGKTVTVQRSLDGAAFASATNTPATEVSNGWYKISLSAGDLNGNTVALLMTASGCDQLNVSIVTSP